MILQSLMSMAVPMSVSVCMTVFVSMSISIGHFMLNVMSMFMSMFIWPRKNIDLAANNKTSESWLDSVFTIWNGLYLDEFTAFCKNILGSGLEVVESLQSHFILTMSQWSSGLPVCFLSQGTWVQIPRGYLCETGILLLELSRYIGDPDMILITCFVALQFTRLRADNV